MIKYVEKPWHVLMADSVMARNPRLSERWSYDYGVVWSGMEALFGLTGDSRYYEYIRRGIDSFLTEDGSIRDYEPETYNLDHINNGVQLLYLYEKTGERKYRDAAGLLVRQLKSQPRTGDGGYWHKQIYPFQMWLDGLYMSAPFRARYAALFHAEDAYADIAWQFALCREHLRDSATGLYRHAWDETRSMPWADKVTGRSPHFWGRAMGWFSAAMADVLRIMPAGPEHLALQAQFRETMDAVLAVQDMDSGVWYQVLDQAARPGNYQEASCSCLFAYALAAGINAGWLPETMLPALKRAKEGIIVQFVEMLNGTAALNKCCQVAGLGGTANRDGSFAYYMSEPIVCNDLKGTGAFIRGFAAMEALRRQGADI